MHALREFPTVGTVLNTDGPETSSGLSMEKTWSGRPSLKVNLMTKTHSEIKSGKAGENII